jgi:hypothetical protein
VLYAGDLAYIAAGEDSLTRDLAPGGYRVRVQPSELSTGAYLLVLSSALEHEPNDGLAEATSLGTLKDAELSVFASIDPAGDVDFFSFDVPEDFSAGLATEASRMVRIETPCPAGDTLLLLYGRDESLGRPVPIARNDDAGAGSWSRLYLADPKPGRYTLRVHEYADNGLIGTYRVVVTAMTLTEREPNDALDAATSLGALDAGGRLARTQFIAEGDVDAFSFAVPTAACVELETRGLSKGDSMITLFASTGDEIARDDDGGNGMWSRLTRNLDPGNYFVTVRAADDESAFDYTLVVATTTCPAEGTESEPNDSTATADAIVLPCDIAAEIVPGNADVYRFEIQTPTTVVAETYGDSSGDTTMCLLDAQGNSLICDDDGGDKLWSRVEYELDTGAYFLRVELFGGTGAVSYRLLVRGDE